MKRGGLWVAGVLLLIGVGSLAVGQGYAQDAEGTGTATCSVATLKGTYLFAYDGLEIKDNDQVPFAFAGYEVYNGNGNVQGVASASVNGEITRNEPFSGTYTVNADCTGTITYTDGTHYDQFIAPDGSLVTFVQTNPGTVAAGFELRGTAKRVGD
jgi:hypothetical protein